MTNLSVTGIIKSYHVFSREFWLSYKALESLMESSLFDSIKMSLMKSKRIDQKYIDIVGVDAYNEAKDKIDAEWKQKNEEAKASGIALHDQLHNLLATDAHTFQLKYNIPTDVYQIMRREEFLKHDGLYPEFRMEIPLNEDFVLIGIPDLVIKSGNKIKIIDYKSDEKIEKDSRYDVAKKKKKCMAYPLGKFPDCNLSHYSLQVSMYAWMIQQLDPDLEIESLELYHIKDGNLKKIYPVEYLKETVESLLKWHCKQIKLEQEILKCREISYD